MVRIELNIHKIFFTVKLHDNRLRYIIDIFNNYLTTYSLFWNKYKKRSMRNKDKEYFSYILRKDEYRYPINVVKLFMNTLGTSNISKDHIKMNFIKRYGSARLNLTWNEQFIPREYQKEYIEELTKPDAKSILLVDLNTGMGKAQWVKTKVKVPNGWKNIGDLQKNDEVITKDGSTTYVTGTYPQGIKDLYEITFSDGRSTTCCKEHLWKIYRDDINSWEILPTWKIIDILHQEQDRPTLYIPLIDSEKNEEKIFNTHPYTLGYSINNQSDLYIPDEYLTGSTEQRQELLKGILGDEIYNKSKSETIFYNTYHLWLCYNIIKLVRSLGGIASYVIKDNKIYNISINLNHDKIAIKEIKFKMSEEAICISVADSSKLYVCEDYIVTHNTFIATKTIHQIDKRTAIVVIPKYIDKWKDDVKKYTDVDDEDIYIVQGGESLLNLMLEEDINYKFIIFSMRTISNYISAYEDGTSGFPVEPPDLMEHLGISILLNDEMHQHFHALTKIMLYFDVERVIGLSATLVSNKRDINRIYSLIVPDTNRISNIIEPDKFRYVRSIKYNLEMNNRIRYKTMKGYNHIMFEQSICRNSIALRDYLNMISYYTKIGYIDRRLEGEKLLIFAASIKLCTLLVEFLKSKYPHIDIRRFVEDDPYENILNAEISVSSIGSAGTAIDIPGLITCINTISMSSLQANIQAFGRLRKIPNRDVWYYYLWTKDIQNQYKMHLDRFEAIKSDTKEFIQDEYPYTIKTK